MITVTLITLGLISLTGLILAIIDTRKYHNWLVKMAKTKTQEEIDKIIKKHTDFANAKGTPRMLAEAADDEADIWREISEIKRKLLEKEEY